MPRLATSSVILLVLLTAVVAARSADSTRAPVGGESTRTPIARESTVGVLRGVNFTHEGFRGEGGGYGSVEADRSMARVRALGANSVAIVPYAFMRDPTVPAPLRIPTGGMGENDERVTRAIQSAQSHGMAVLLKPQIWLRGSWPGEITMRSEADWDLFFGHYEAWITHYARLAEELEVDILSLGVELGKATVGHEDRWVELAARVREVYGGELVYAANWYGELDDLGFWRAFDYIGVDSYYPLSGSRNASDADLLSGALEVTAKLASLHERYDRPVMLTEIGFASTEAPWREPHASERSPRPNAQHQARSYEAMIAALDEAPWLGGVFWWKWPSHGREAGPQHRGFSPLGKQAEDALAKWLGGEP